MPKTKISEFDSTPANNTDIDSINIAEGCAPSGINNAIRELMSQLKDQQTGASGDGFTVAGTLALTGGVTLDGSSGTAGQILLSAGSGNTPTWGDSFVTGMAMMWTTGTAPTGWLLCAGAAVSRSTYSALFAVIGTTFGVGDGSTTFNLPNYTNRMPYGTTVGATGGTADAVVVSHTHTFTGTALGTHNHSTTFNQTQKSGNNTNFMISNPSSGENINGSVALDTSSVSAGTPSGSISTEGVSGTNANLPPYLGINFIIKT
jgi:microcystin-dependent protein